MVFLMKIFDYSIFIYRLAIGKPVNLVHPAV